MRTFEIMFAKFLLVEYHCKEMHDLVCTDVLKLHAAAVYTNLKVMSKLVAKCIII